MSKLSVAKRVEWLRAGARRVLGNLVRSAGIAPASPGWHPGILLLNDDRVGRRGCYD
jgi:hypothetical protein